MAMKRLIFLSMMLMGTVAMAAGPAKVLLVPFDSVGPVEKEWVAKALQQNLIAVLRRVNSFQRVTCAGGVGGLEAALTAGGDGGADYVVFGSYQAVEGDLRITGQVVEVSKRQAVAGLKSTGSQRDLFGMEDVISNQVKRALPQPVAVAKPEMLQQPPAAPPAIEPNGPVVMDLNERARELENQIDRAMDRIRYSIHRTTRTITIRLTITIRGFIRPTRRFSFRFLSGIVIIDRILVRRFRGRFPVTISRAVFRRGARCAMSGTTACRGGTT
jgi:TolB-like protein